MTLLLLLSLFTDDETVRVDGPPFLAFDAEADFEIVPSIEDATPVWRISDAPGGAVRAVETEPEFSSKDHSIRGVKKTRVKAVGKMEGDLRLTVNIERGGRRVATITHVVRIGNALRLPVRFRLVEHAKGGPDPARYRDSARLAAEVNAIWKSCGVEFEFEMGKAIPGKPAWFDDEGRFQPVDKSSGVREKSASLAELWKLDDPAFIDVFVVRDAHWTEKKRGMGGAVIDHTLAGVGIKEESALIDDSASAVVLAHELGHVLGLDDLACECLRAWERPASERRRLMFSVNKYRTGIWITPEEMKTSRATALKILKQQGAKR